MPWLDAAWHPAGWVEGLVPFDPGDRGLLLGDGVFDTSMVLGGRMVWRAAHLRRLVSHAAALGIVVDPTRLDAAVDGALRAVGGGHSVLRLTVTRGAGRRGVAPPVHAYPTLLATLAPLPAVGPFTPLALHPSAIPRNAHSPLSRVKSLNYGDTVLAAAAALAAGCDDSLVLNTAGRVSCAGVGNLFAVSGTELATPPPAEGALDGIARAALLSRASRLGLRAVERALAPAELEAADAVVCTNSLRLIAPIIALGQRPLAAGSCGARLAELMAEAVRDDVGVDPRALGPT